MLPQVAVVIPTRNRRALLARTLRSALTQEAVEVEVVVVDEASTDGTRDEVAAVGDDRVSLVRHETAQGVAAARNAGLARAGAEWVAFLDDDDLWAPTKLPAQLKALEAMGDCGWSCTSAVVVDAGLNVVGLEAIPATDGLVERLLSYNAIPGGGSSVLARTELVRELGGFDPDLSVVADWDLWIRLALHSPLAAVPTPLVAYLRHAGSMSRRLKAIRGELTRVAEKHAGVRGDRGLTFPWDRWLVWAAAMHRRAGHRREPAGIYARLALQRRSPTLFAKAALAAAWPGWIDVRDWLAAREVSPGLVAEAERWLGPLRAPDTRLRDGAEALA